MADSPGGSGSDRARYVEPDVFIPPSSGGVTITMMLAFLTVVSWSLAGVFTYVAYENGKYQDGFIDPLLYDVLPWYLAAVGITAITMAIGLAVTAELLLRRARRP